MSLFEKSFERELGKNTGKWVSNVVFGDRHSTPYRRVGDRTRTEAKIASEEAKIEMEKEQQLFAIDAAVLRNIDTVVSFRFSKNKEELLQQLSEFEIQLKANKWHNVSVGDNEVAKIRNKFCDSLFEKYKQGVRTLNSINPDGEDLEYFEKIQRKTARWKFFRKYPFYIGFTLFFFVMICLAMEEAGLALMTIFFGGFF